MESRLSELFQRVCTTEQLTTIDELSRLFKVSNRTILNDIEKVNGYLKQHDFPPIQVKNKRISYPLKLYLTFSDLLVNKSELLLLDEEIRRKQLLLDMLLDMDHFSITAAIAKYGLSRNTIIKEIKTIRAALSTQGIELIPISFVGYHLSGDEAVIRRLAASLFPVAKINIFASSEFVAQLEELSQLLSVLLEKLNRRISQTAFERLLAYFWVSYSRFQQQHFIPKKETVEQLILEELILQSIPLFHQLFATISHHPEDLKYLADRVAEASLLDPEERLSDDWLSRNVIVLDFINSVSKLTEESYFCVDTDLFEGILTHLRPATKRLLNGEELLNPLYDEVISHFKELHEAVLESLPALERKLGVTFTLQESSFLTLFFESSLQRKRFQKRVLNDIIIVCNEGISTSQMLNSRLQRVFAFNILGTFSKREALAWQQTHHADLIITTVDIPEARFPTIKVNALLLSEDIERIQKISNQSLKEIHADEILTVIKRRIHLTKEQESAIFSDLTFLLQGTIFKQKQKKEEKKEPMLMEVLTQATIEANYPAKDREDAVRECGRLLVQSGAARESYVEGMLENVQVNGTYIVIAPGIAMPHARPEKGAIKIGFSLLTLQDPIKFNHPTNDPVKLVIGLCATDHQTHLKALSELVETLSHQEIITQLYSAKTSQEIYSIIKGGTEND